MEVKIKLASFNDSPVGRVPSSAWKELLQAAGGEVLQTGRRQGNFHGGWRVSGLGRPPSEGWKGSSETADQDILGPAVRSGVQSAR